MNPGAISSELSALIDKISKDVAVVVEGKKDKAALEQLGIESNKIYVLNKKPLFAVAEEIAVGCTEIVILTDLDAEGKKLYGKLYALLQSLGVKVDDRVRNFLFKNTKLRQIEGITNLIQHE